MQTVDRRVLDAPADITKITLAQLRKEYTALGLILYTYAETPMGDQARARLDAIKAECDRRGKPVRPARKSRW